jgi:hypothetical protein
MTQARDGLFFFLLLLVFAFSSILQYANAHEPAYLYHDNHLGIRGHIAPDDHLDGSDPGAIPLVRIEHRHVGKRSAYLQLLPPTKDINLDWQFRRSN